MSEEKKKSIGALWEKLDKNGNPYFSCKYKDEDVIIFKNGFKEQDNHPDYLIYEREKRDGNQ